MAVPRRALDSGALAAHIPGMADEPENLTLKMLRRMDAKLDRLVDDLQDVKMRLGSLEQKMAIVVTDIARIDGRLDGFEQRLGRIEKRLELIEA
jgi:septal ring factor EnvC (AmiA/AmiB activator)